MSHLTPYYCKLNNFTAIVIWANPFAKNYSVRSVRIASMRYLQNSVYFEECEEIEPEFALAEIKEYITFLDKGIDMGYDLEEKKMQACEIHKKLQDSIAKRSAPTKHIPAMDCISVTVVVEAYNDCYN